MLKRHSSSSSLLISKSSSVSATSAGGLFTSSRILLARKEDEEAAKKWKLPSFLTKFLDQTAPAHLRGSYLAEERELKAKAEEMEKQQKEAEKKKAERKSAATQAAKVSFSSEERGFVKTTGSSSSPSKKMSSQDKYGVNWSNEETAAEDASNNNSASSSSSSSPSSRFGTNLSASKQFVDEEAAATDVLAGNQATAQQAALGKAGKKEKGPSMFNRMWSTLKMTREDASAIRDEDADNEAKGLRDDELQTGKYFKKLHKTSLKSWTKQCFQRMPEVEGCKLISVEVEINPETDIVSVFVTAEDLDDKKLTLVKKWVEAICPVTKAREKLIQKMEEEDRKRQSHVLASPTGPASGSRYANNNSNSRRNVVTDPLKQFAKRKNIRWIRIDPDN